MLTMAAVRVVAAFVFAYLILPILRPLRAANPTEALWLVIERFALITAAVQISAAALAAGGLPQATGLIAVWFLIAGWAAFGVRGSQIRPLLLKLLRGIEAWHMGPALRMVWTSATTPAALGAALLLLVFLHRAAFSLGNWRFETLEQYERTFSLFQMAASGAQSGNSSLPLLVPLVLIGGLDAASVVRFADPLFSTLICLAAGLCAYAVSRRYTAAMLAFTFAGLLPVVLDAGIAKPSAAQQMATLFWLITLVLAYNRRLGAVASGITAVLIGGEPAIYPVLVAGCAALALVIDTGARRVNGWDSLPARVILAAGLASALVPDLARPVPDGPYQYESAAMTAERIARTFPRGQWFVVSPTHELTSVLGRGWHVELFQFLKQYSEEAVAAPDFKFPWEADIFIFVEKQPLARPNATAGRYHGGHGMAMIDDAVVQAYGTPLGRASTQWRLARLIAAFARSHDNISSYYQDDKLTVYRISKDAASLSVRAW